MELTSSSPVSFKPFQVSESLVNQPEKGRQLWVGWEAQSPQHIWAPGGTLQESVTVTSLVRRPSQAGTVSTGSIRSWRAGRLLAHNTASSKAGDTFSQNVLSDAA